MAHQTSSKSDRDTDTEQTKAAGGRSSLEEKEQLDFLSTTVRPTIKRYVIIVLFAINSGNKSFQWIQIAATTTKSAYFYGVDNYTINTTSIVFLWSFLVLSWPACFIIDRIGLRKAVLIASFGTALGSIVKCFSCYQEGVWLLMIAQVLVSMSEQLIYSAPARLASVWFPDHQVSTAVAICVLGNMMGIALGFQLPQLFLYGAETKETIGRGLFWLYAMTMIVSVSAFILDYLFFDDEPKYAPGLARLKQRNHERQFKDSRSHQKTMKKDVILLFGQIGRLFNNTPLVLLVVSYGIRFSITDMVATLLSQIVGPIWPGDDILVGNLGFLMIVGGALGLPAWGHYLDKFHRYKQTAAGASLLAILAYCGFYYQLIISGSKLLLYVALFLFGLFHLGSSIASLELAVELTYPAPELVTISLMNVTGPIFGSVCIYLGSYIADNYAPAAINGFVLANLLVALLSLACCRETQRRQIAAAKDKQKEDAFNQAK